VLRGCEEAIGKKWMAGDLSMFYVLATAVVLAGQGAA
jgi:hypothetical protein